MASKNSIKTCEAEGNACKKDVQALCYHCSKNLCGTHLMQHVQLMEDKTRTELHSLADKFNEISSRFDHLSISPSILKRPFDQLEKWCAEAHAKIDQIAENKRREINEKFAEYEQVFVTMNNEKIKKMNASKKLIVSLIQENNTSRKQIIDLEASIIELEKHLSSLTTHKINVLGTLPTLSVDIHTKFFDLQPLKKEETGEFRTFKIIYVRQNGILRTYKVKTNKDGKIKDLKTSFVQQYILLDEINQSTHRSTDTVNHSPIDDFILAVEIYNNRVDCEFNDDRILKTIHDRDMIAFYETPYSLNEKDNPQILMPCIFQRLETKTSFGWPIYLTVPRKGCRGQHVLDALHDTLGKFFPLNPKTDQHLYDANLQCTVSYNSKPKGLKDILQDEIDFNKGYGPLLVGIISQIADIYEQNISKQLAF